MTQAPVLQPAIVPYHPCAPCAVTLLRIGGGDQWSVSVRPFFEICTSVADVRVLPDSRKLDPAMRNAFIQVLINLLMVNRMELSVPAIYSIRCAPERLTFIYRLRVGETLYVPPLPPLPGVSLRFSHDERGSPALRLDVMRQTPNSER